MQNTLKKIGSGISRKVATGAAVIAATIVSASAQTGSGNTGADAIIAKVEGLAPVAVAVIGAAVLVVVVPWGAKMAIKAFKSITGG